MNLDDLRAELHSRADDLDAHTTGRMAGIRAKAAASRRRNTGIVAVVVLIVGAVIGIPALDELRSEPDPIEKPDGPFPETVDGDTRIAQAIGDEGDSTVVLTSTPDDTAFLLGIGCSGVRGTASEDLAWATVNQHPIDTGCGAGPTRGTSVAYPIGSVPCRLVNKFADTGRTSAWPQASL